MAQPGLAGTTPAQGDAYAAMGARVAAIGLGTTVFAYQSRSGAPAWESALAGFRAGSRIVSVRVWPGVVTAGVDVPGRQPGSAVTRHEVILDSGTGRLLRTYPAAAFGGAVAANPARTVIVGETTVTSYSNRTGAVLWSRPTGRAAQAWKVSGNDLYLTVSAGGYLSNGPVRALRKIFLRSGVQRLIRPPGRSFRGVLSRVFDGVAVFTDARGTIAYSATTGRRLWRRLGAVPGNADTPGGLLYLTDGSSLAGVEPRDRPDPGSRVRRIDHRDVRLLCCPGRRGARPRPGGPGRRVGLRRGRGPGAVDQLRAAVAALFRGPVRYRRQHRPDVGRDSAGGLRAGRGGGGRQLLARSVTGPELVALNW